jgi:hypothetical protein
MVRGPGLFVDAGASDGSARYCRRPGRGQRPFAAEGRLIVARGKQAGAPLIGPHDWVPIDVALAQIKALVGYAEPSMRELHRDLCGGQLVGASRRIDRETGQEVHEVHKPLFWDQVAMREFQENVKVDHPPRRWKMLSPTLSQSKTLRRSISTNLRML